MGAVNGMNQYLNFFGISGTDSGGGVGTGDFSGTIIPLFRL
jgi:hypothetical protein